MEPHQTVQITRVQQLSRDESLIVTRLELGQRYRLRSSVTQSMTLVRKQGVSNLKHKRRNVIVETSVLMVTQTLGGVVVSAVQQEDARGTVMLPLVTLPASSGEPDYEQLVNLALLRQEDVPALPEQVNAESLRAGLESAKAAPEESATKARRRRESAEAAPVAPAVPSSADGDEDSPF